MNKLQAALYTLAVGLILFSLFLGLISGVATDEIFIGISSFLDDLKS